MLVNNQPMEFTLRTLKGEVNYNGPEWIKTFETIANLTKTGVLGAGSGALSVDAAYQLFNQGKAAMLYTGSWSLPALAGSPGVELHATGLPLVGNAQKAQPIIAFNGYAIATASKNKDAALRWLNYTADPAVDEELVDKLQAFSPMPASNSVIKDPIAREVAPWFADGIVSLDWLWEPEVTTEIQNQVQGLVKGDTQPQAAADAVQARADAVRREGRSYYKWSSRQHAPGGTQASSHSVRQGTECAVGAARVRRAGGCAGVPTCEWSAAESAAHQWLRPDRVHRLRELHRGRLPRRHLPPGGWKHDRIYSRGDRPANRCRTPLSHPHL
jgi:hypothetical protein